MPSRLEEFYQAHPEMAPRAPISELREAADRWAGGEFQGDWSRIAATRGPEIAEWYARQPDYDQRAVPSFRAMREETKRQFEFLTGTLGVDVEVTPGDPYPDPGSMMDDIGRGRLKVLSTQSTGGHPYFSNDENDMFRAVHDAFGHAATGRGFDRHGEEAAWVSHSRMFSPLARPAMTAETRGQNSFLNYGPNPGQFGPQKIVMAPRQFTRLRNLS